MVTLHTEDERLHLLARSGHWSCMWIAPRFWRKSSQLLVCFGVGRRGLATSKLGISHWVRDAISLAYEARNLPSPLKVRSHQTRMTRIARMIYMLSQCKDAKDNPAALFARKRRHELSLFFTRMARVEKSELWRIFAPRYPIRSLL